MFQKHSRNDHIKRIAAIGALTAFLCCSCSVQPKDSSSTPLDADTSIYIKPVEYIPLEVLKNRGELADLFPDFEFSELNIDSEPFYKLDIPGHETFMTVDGGQTELTIHRGQNEVSIPLHTNLFWSAIYAPPVLTLVDLTGDGEKELVYIASDGGTGAHSSTCRIFDLDTLTEYPISNVVQELGQLVDVKPVSISEENQVLCEIRLGTDEPVYGAVQGSKDMSLEDYHVIDAEDSSLFYIWLTDDGELWASVVLTLNGAQLNCNLFEVKSNIVYHQATNSFVLGTKHEVSV